MQAKYKYVSNVIPYKSAIQLRTIARYTDFNQNPSSVTTMLVSNMQTIQQSLDNLFNCNKYKRRYMPDYYVPMDEIIGELFGTLGARQALVDIAYYVELNEPRVQCFTDLSELQVHEDRNTFKLDLVIMVPSLSNDEQYVYTIEKSVI